MNILPLKIQVPVNSTAVPQGASLFKIHPYSSTGLKGLALREINANALNQPDVCFFTFARKLKNYCWQQITASSLVLYQLHA